MTYLIEVRLVLDRLKHGMRQRLNLGTKKKGKQ